MIDLKVIDDYKRVEEEFENTRDRLRQFLENLRPQITKVIVKVYTSVYKIKKSEISWDYFEASEYDFAPFGGLEAADHSLEVWLDLDHPLLCSDAFDIDLTRLDDPSWITEKIEDLQIERDNNQLKADNKKAILEKEIKKLQKQVKALS